MTLSAQDEVAQLERDCEAGTAEACMNLGSRFGFGAHETTMDRTRAVGFWEQACNLEDGLGCRWFGQFCEDPTRAASAYQKGCDLGDDGACGGGASLHAHDGGLPDPARHASFMEKACDLEVGLYCLRLGLMYDIGFRVPKDTARANELFKKGCLFENEEACNLIRR